MSAIDELSKLQQLIGRISGVVDYFKPFKPSLSNIRFDYRRKTCQAGFLIDVKSGLRRRTSKKVEIPIFLGFDVKEVIDLETGRIVPITYVMDGRKWVFDASNFPNTEKYLVRMEGNVDTDYLDGWVEFNNPTNPSREKGRDRYWIHAALVDARHLKTVHDEFEIHDVYTDVKVGVRSVFSLAIPKALEKALRSTSEFVKAGLGKQHSVLRERQRMKQAYTKLKQQPSDIIVGIYELVEDEYFRDFISVDKRFAIESIQSDMMQTTVFPETVSVEVSCSLSLEQPAVKGFLDFHRKKYLDNVSEKVKKMIDTENEKKRSLPSKTNT